MKKTGIVWILCCMMWMMSANILFVHAGNSQVPANSGDTDIYAGVVVNYMAKLRFLVLNRDTQQPVSGASIEIYIPSLERYILFGATNADGIFDLDVAYDMQAVTGDSSGSKAGFETIDGNLVFTGSLLFLPDNNLKYKVYKATWLPYPQFGEAKISTEQIPFVLTTYLYQENKPEETTKDRNKGGGGSSSGKLLGAGAVKETESTAATTEDGGTGIDTLPKTGVEGFMNIWFAGFFIFMVAILLIIWLIRKEKQSREEEDRQKNKR